MDTAFLGIPWETMKSVMAVRAYLMELSREFPEEWNSIERNRKIPMGDISYGIAVTRWGEAGKPTNSYFTFEDPLPPCPYVMKFREHLSKKFGLPILTSEEVKEWKEFRKQEHSSGLLLEAKSLRN